MPYIKQEDRINVPAATPGELNYKITRLVHIYLTAKGGINYSNLNEVLGVLECAKLEVYRVLAANYEDEKRKENGAISSLDSI